MALKVPRPGAIIVGPSTRKGGEYVWVLRRPLGSDEDRDGAKAMLTSYCALSFGRGTVFLRQIRMSKSLKIGLIGAVTLGRTPTVHESRGQDSCAE